MATASKNILWCDPSCISAGIDAAASFKFGTKAEARFLSSRGKLTAEDSEDGPNLSLKYEVVALLSSRACRNIRMRKRPNQYTLHAMVHFSIATLLSCPWTEARGFLRYRVLLQSILARLGVFAWRLVMQPLPGKVGDRMACKRGGCDTPHMLPAVSAFKLTVEHVDSVMPEQGGLAVQPEESRLAARGISPLQAPRTGKVVGFCCPQRDSRRL